MGRSGKSKSQRAHASNTVELDDQVLDSFLPPGIVAKKKPNKSANEKKPSYSASAAALIFEKNVKVLNNTVEDVEVEEFEKDKVQDSDFVFVDSSAVKEEEEVRNELGESLREEVLSSFVVGNASKLDVVEKVESVQVLESVQVVEPAEIQNVESLEELNTADLAEKIAAEEQQTIGQVVRADAVSLENISLNELEPENPVKVTSDEQNYIFQAVVDDTLPLENVSPKPIYQKDEILKQIPIAEDDAPKKRSWFFCCS
jgi:hypothetical protein